MNLSFQWPKDTFSHESSAKGIARDCNRRDRISVFALTGLSFLAERFNLKMHTEQRTMQALVLTIDGAGNKMTPNTTDHVEKSSAN